MLALREFANFIIMNNDQIGFCLGLLAIFAPGTINLDARKTPVLKPLRGTSAGVLCYNDR